jgi:hypothetical protein
LSDTMPLSGTKTPLEDKLPGAPLFTEDGDTPWRRHVWARAVRAAIKITIGMRARSGLEEYSRRRHPLVR